MLWLLWCVGGTVWAVDIALSIEPSPAVRGTALAITAEVVADPGTPLGETTLNLPLPVGLDQWSSDVRIDGGGWSAYPANGLIPLDAIPPAGQCTIEIRTMVEHTAPGTLTASARLTDAAGPLAEASTWANVLPSVDAGADLVIGQGVSVTLRGTSAADGGAGIAGIAWSDGNAGGSFDDPWALHPTYTPDIPTGLVQLTLTVTDLDGGTASDSLRLWVNAPPSVDVGPDHVCDEGEAIELSTAMATDTDGWIVATAWSDGGAGGRFEPSADLLNPMYISPILPGPGDATIELTLTATDDRGGVGIDGLVLTVRNLNVSPSVDAGPDRVCDAGETIELSAATAMDADGRIVATSWSDGGAGGRFEPSADVLAPTYRPPTADRCADMQWVLTLTVTDDADGQASDALLLTVRAANRPPTIDAGGARAVVSGEAVVLAATAEDPDGDILDLRWEQIGGPSVSLDPAARTGTVGFDAPDVTSCTSLAFRAMATDGCGESASDLVTVEVSPAEVGGARSALSVRIEAFDERGLSLLPFDQVADGDPVVYRVIVTNTGEAAIAEVSATTADGIRVMLDGSLLDPLESVVGRLERTAERTGSGDRFVMAIDALGFGTDGRPVTASDVWVLYVRAAEASLSLRASVDRRQAEIGDRIHITYTLRNDGTANLVGLALIDDALGPIGLSDTRLGAGEACMACVEYVVRASDLPGPAVHVATATAFTRSAQRIEANASVSVDLRSGDIAGGGAMAAATSSSAIAGPVFSEIAWAGTPGDPTAEWIELANPGLEPVDLTGWRLGWYEKGGAVPEAGAWNWIELTGRIDPLPRSTGSLRFVEEEHGIWRVVDERWSGGTAGTFLLERGDDDAVSDIAATLIYDEGLELSDAGAALFLIAPDGQIVDSANATHPTRPGWTAGCAESTATMERVRLDIGDQEGNWQTHAGVLLSGCDVRGRPLLASAGRPSGPSLDDLIEAAADAVPHVLADGMATIPLPAAGYPVIRVAATGGPAVAGAGGSVATPVLSTCRVEGRSWLEADLSGASSGTYDIWIAYPGGIVYLAPLVAR